MNRYFAAFLAFSLCVSPAVAGGIEPDQPYLFKTKQGKAVEYQRRAPQLEEMIQRTDYPYAQMQPIPLKGVKIGGLGPKSIDTLGWNYFLVVDNTKYSKMSEIYRDSRLAGKSNFVTTDSIIHPYLAFTNRVVADAITIQMVPDLLLLLDSMQQVALNDYRNSQDVEVRGDIEHNVAYLAVAMRLLNPFYEFPQIGQVPKLAEADLRNIYASKWAQSAVFDRGEDFSMFKPMGFYSANEKLQGYFKAREWLSRLSFPIIDSSISSEGHATNAFRRSVLLYRTLDQSFVLGKPSIEVWSKLVKASALLGTPLDNLKERTLYPTDYTSVFADRPTDLKVTLNALAEPLFRTKLMLAIRKQKPANFSSASIFELDNGGSEANAAAHFRLFPIIAQPEQPWMRSVAKFYPPDKEAAASWPISLMDQYIWGAPAAGNVLSDNMWCLDPNIAKVLPELANCVTRRAGGGQVSQVESRNWKLLTAYFKPPQEGVPSVMRSEQWFSHRLVSASGAWVDAQCAMAPDKLPDPPVDPTAAASGAQPAESATGDGVTGVPTSAEAAPVPRRISKSVPYHYLEPNLDLYRAMEADGNKIQADLVASKYLPEKYKAQFADWMRLLQRLEKISETELRQAPLSYVDKKLLGNIDQILDRVDVPLPAVLAFQAPSQRPATPPRAASPATPSQTARPAAGAAKTNALKAGELAPITHATARLAAAAAEMASPPAELASGMNLAVGRPGQLYVIYQNPHNMEWTLGRGAVYTYYEMPAPLLTESMWKHKIEAGFAAPIAWSQKFQVVQKDLPPAKPPTATAAR